MIFKFMTMNLDEFQFSHTLFPLLSHSPRGLIHTFFVLKSPRAAPLFAPSPNNIFFLIHWEKIEAIKRELPQILNPKSSISCNCIHIFCFSAGYTEDTFLG